MTAYFPKGDKSVKSDDQAAADDDDGPSQLSGGVQKEGKKSKGKGKGEGKGEANFTSDGEGTSGGGGGGGGWRSKPGHSYRSIRDNGKPFHTPEEIAASRTAEYERRSTSAADSTSWAKGKGGKGGGWQRSGGAAESDEMSKEELEYQLLQERAAVTEARLKLFDAKKSDNNRGAAAPLSDGWDA